MIGGLESHAAEKGLIEMLKDHPDAKRICCNDFEAADRTKFEADGVIIGGSEVMLVEAKTNINKTAIKQVEKRIEKIRSLVRNEGDSTQLSRLFYDKKLIVVVAGQVIDSLARKELLGKVADGWRVWLPDGSGLALGDACFEGYGKGLEGTSSIHEGIGRKSLPTATALPTRIALNRASRQIFQLLPGRRVQHLSLPRLSMGGTLKLGWK